MVWLASHEALFLKGKFLWANWDVKELKARSEEIEAKGLLSLGLVGWPFEHPGYLFQTAPGEESLGFGNLKMEGLGQQ